MWDLDNDIQPYDMRNMTSLRDLAIPVDLISSGTTEYSINWDHNPLPPLLKVLQLQYCYVPQDAINIHEASVEYLNRRLHEREDHNVATGYSAWL